MLDYAPKQSWGDNLQALHDEFGDDIFHFSVCLPLEPYNIGNTPYSEGCTVDHECAPLDEFTRSMIPSHTDDRVRCTPIDEVVDLQAHTPAMLAQIQQDAFNANSTLPRHASFCCHPPAAAKKICLPYALNRPLPADTAVARSYEADGPTDECRSERVTLSINVGAVPMSIEHLGWQLDGIVGPDPIACGATQSNYRCVYKANRNYTQSLCLTPGKHVLYITDGFGFGWLDANISLTQTARFAAPKVDTERTLTLVNSSEGTFPSTDCDSSCGRPPLPDFTVIVNVTTDRYPQETSWRLLHIRSGEVVASGTTEL
jgi:hypothetical protein